jgi:hypothetical protein
MSVIAPSEAFQADPMAGASAETAISRANSFLDRHCRLRRPRSVQHFPPLFRSKKVADIFRRGG